jgi:hypothetical protein
MHMPNYVVRVRPIPQSLQDRSEVRVSERHAMEDVREVFPQVEWLSNFICGPCEYMEILGAPDLQTAEQVSERIRRHGLATEVWPLAPLGEREDG